MNSIRVPDGGWEMAIRTEDRIAADSEPEDGRDKYPLVSVVISNYNGANYLQRCLSSLLNSDYPRVEIVVVDAGSTDGSVEIIRGSFPEVRLFEAKGAGIATALNIVIRRSRGELLLIDFNSDEFASPMFLRILVDALQSRDEIGAVGGTRLQDGGQGIIDSMGGKVYLFGFYPRYGHGEKYTSVSHKPFEVDYLRHMLVRRHTLDRVGLFDEDFFIYGEDTDFCIRLKKPGYKVVQVPSATTQHAGSGTVGSHSPRYVYYNERAHIQLILKHCPLPLIPIGAAWTALIVGIYLGCQFRVFRKALSRTRLSYMARRGSPAHLLAVLQAIGWNIERLAQTFATRRRAASK